MNNNKTELKNHIKLNNFPFHIELWHPETSIPLHYHDCAEILLTADGSALCQVGDVRLKFTKGDLFIISGDVAHTLHDVKDFSAYRILFDFSLLEELDETLKKSPGYVTMFTMSSIGCGKRGYPSCLVVNDLYFERITTVMNDMIHEYSNNGYMQEYYLRQSFYLLITLILKSYDDRVQHKEYNTSDLAIPFIENHLHEKISISDMAKQFGLSEQYFRYLFEKQWGISPMQFIIDLRIRKAKTLLLLSDMPIVKIAMACGFYDSSHFSNTFLKSEGIPPNEYRKKFSSH